MTMTYFHDNTNTINTLDLQIADDTPKLNVLSLFSGAGGMDLGFSGGFQFLNEVYSQNPFNLLFANDIFKQAVDVYETNFEHSVERKSIVDLNKSDIDHKIKENANSLEVPEIDVLLGGFPCQTFSYSGKRGGLSDPRGQLYLQMIKVLDYYRPKFFVAENVDGIRNSRKNQIGEDVDKSALDTILDDFTQHGYTVQYKVLNAADFGVPQNRRRVIIFGIRSDLGDLSSQYYPLQLFDETGKQTGRPWRTSLDGIDDIWDKVNDPTIPNHTMRDISKAKFYPGKKMQGNNQISPDKPSPTIRAEHHGNIEAHYRNLNGELYSDDMDTWRRLSVRECARLQSFPDSFNFTTSASSAYKAIGNAVPPVMAWHIARAVYYSLQNIQNS